MNGLSSPNVYFNVARMPLAGRLDEISKLDTDRDLWTIKQYIEAEKHSESQRPGVPNPPIARAVLVSVWETPRVRFHREELDGRKGIAFGSKLLLIPWSAEAFDRLKQSNCAKGLILEHVTPVDALWARLKELDAESESYDDWAASAQAYLGVHYTLAVVTIEQAKAIDKVGFRKTGTPRNPFDRYLCANKKIAQPFGQGQAAGLVDVAKFCYPGIL